MSLEFLLRAYIARSNNLEKQTCKLEKLEKGIKVDKHPMTWYGKYNSFSEVVDRFNKIVPEEEKIDRDKIIQLRNALAHARMFSLSESSPPIMLNFKEVKGEILVTEKVIMDEEWFKQNINWIFSEAKRILEKYNHLGCLNEKSR